MKKNVDVYTIVHCIRVGATQIAFYKMLRYLFTKDTDLIVEANRYSNISGVAALILVIKATIEYGVKN